MLPLLDSIKVSNILTQEKWAISLYKRFAHTVCLYVCMSLRPSACLFVCLFKIRVLNDNILFLISPPVWTITLPLFRL